MTSAGSASRSSRVPGGTHHFLGEPVRGVADLTFLVRQLYFNVHGYPLD